MRAAAAFIVGILVIAFIVGLVIFGLQNEAIRGYSFLGLTFTFPVWAMVALAALAGFILGLLVVTPARASAEAGHRAMRATLRRQENELAQMRTANEQLQGQLSALQAEHGNVVRERDAYRTVVETLRTPGSVQAQEQPQGEPVAEQTVAYAAPADGARDGGVVERRVTSEAETVTPDGVAPDRAAAPVASGSAPQTAEASRPTFGDRLRTFFAKPEAERTDVPPRGRPRRPSGHNRTNVARARQSSGKRPRGTGS